MTDCQYIATTDTAKLLRKMLKAAFPETKFSVRSHSYSGGSSIHIGWVDGPTSKAVDALAKPLEGASFDGMQDLKTYNGPLVVAGARVRFGGHFIFMERKHSSALLEFALGKVCDWWRCQPCEIAVSKYDSSYAFTTSDGERNVGGGHFSTSDLVHQLTSVTSAVGGTFAFDDDDRPGARTRSARPCDLNPGNVNVRSLPGGENDEEKERTVPRRKALRRRTTIAREAAEPRPRR